MPDAEQDITLFDMIVCERSHTVESRPVGSVIWYGIPKVRWLRPHEAFSSGHRKIARVGDRSEWFRAYASQL